MVSQDRSKAGNRKRGTLRTERDQLRRDLLEGANTLGDGVCCGEEDLGLEVGKQYTAEFRTTVLLLLQLDVSKQIIWTARSN